MSSARTHRLAAMGTLCRRPVAVLTPLAPLVVLVFAIILLSSTIRAGLDRRVASQELESPEPTVAAAEGRVARGLNAARPTPRRLLGGAAAMFGAILVAAVMAGGTYAFLNARATTPAISVSSGTLTVTVKYGSNAAASTAAIPTTAWATMLPGDFVGQQITIANSGDAKATVTAALSTMSAWDIRVVAGTCPATQLTSTPLSTTVASLGTFAVGASTVYCVQATLPTNAAAAIEATSAPLAIQLAVTQVTS